MENSYDKVFLFGCGKKGRDALEFLGTEQVEGFIDNDIKRIGTSIFGKKVISLEDYINYYYGRLIIVTPLHSNPIIDLLNINNIMWYTLFSNLKFGDRAIPKSVNISHDKWPNLLKELSDYKDNKVLEVGSRVVGGANFRSLFQKAHYMGFDYYQGPNVDVVGDAHKLSSYFDCKFDLIFSCAVFEHLAMPWIVAKEMIDLLKPGGYIFIETHYSYSSHERPWHFFQFSENALKILFPEAAGITCIEAGTSNPIIGYFTEEASPYLRGKNVPDMYCHSEFLGKKIREEKNFSWNNLNLEDVVGKSVYPKTAIERE